MAPAVASAMLVGLLALQLGWTRPIVLPAPEPITPLRLEPVSILPVSAASAILQHALFSPGRGSALGGDLSSSAPLGGAVPVGVVVRAGRALVFVQAPGGGATALAIGQTYRGWTLQHVGPGGLAVRRGAQTATLPIASSSSAGAPPVTPSPSASE